MRNALLFLAISLTILFLVGGPDALTEALVRLLVLGGLQMINHYLRQSDEHARRELEKIERHRLKKETRKDLKSGPR